MNRSRKRPADAMEDAWVADEDKFVLQQAKKKAAIRVKEGRAKPSDWLAVTLRFVDPSREAFDDDTPNSGLAVVNPQSVFEGLNEEQLLELEKDIGVFLALETNTASVDFWKTMQVISKERRHLLDGGKSMPRAQDSTSSDVDKLFKSKSLPELERLEGQIKLKLQSHEPIDIEYWEDLLQNLVSWKAKAKLQDISRAVMDNQLLGLRRDQAEEARREQQSMKNLLRSLRSGEDSNEDLDIIHLDPLPLLKIRAEDKALTVEDEKDFLNRISAHRDRVTALDFVPATPASSATRGSAVQASRHQEDTGQTTNSMYDREAARGFGEDEEAFASEEQLSTNQPQWADKHRPRKPRYFNRVQMGYEWNKYNQTHYDHDNAPPKVVQGYKFNIFYPDLIDPTKAPTFKIIREGGRKRGQTFAPAGEEDTCVIKFVAGPPYEDVAFRVVDREWDYSAKRERGFRSSFDKGILQLHFQFKKIFYRK